VTVSILFTLTDPRFDETLATESTKILRRAIELLRDGEEVAPLFDSKGNEVGTFRVTE
jgi:hypothetical protein